LGWGGGLGLSVSLGGLDWISAAALLCVLLRVGGGGAAVAAQTDPVLLSGSYQDARLAASSRGRCTAAADSLWWCSCDSEMAACGLAIAWLFPLNAVYHYADGSTQVFGGFAVAGGGEEKDSRGLLGGSPGRRFWVRGRRGR